LKSKRNNTKFYDDLVVLLTCDITLALIYVGIITLSWNLLDQETTKKSFELIIFKILK